LLGELNHDGSAGVVQHRPCPAAIRTSTRSSTAAFMQKASDMGVMTDEEFKRGIRELAAESRHRRTPWGPSGTR
jgi:hypothetical protein